MPTDENNTTRFEYNLDGNLVKLIAENPTTAETGSGEKNEMNAS